MASFLRFPSDPIRSVGRGGLAVCLGKIGKQARIDRLFLLSGAREQGQGSLDSMRHLAREQGQGSQAKIDQGRENYAGAGFG